MQRLKTRSQFQAVLGGERVAATAHFVLHRCPLDSGASRPTKTSIRREPIARLFASAVVCIGAMVPKRWAKHAVTRNTIRRQIYSVSADFELALPRAAHVVRLRSVFDRTRFVSASSKPLKLVVREELVQLFTNSTMSATAGDTSGGAR